MVLYSRNGLVHRCIIGILLSASLYATSVLGSEIELWVSTEAASGSGSLHEAIETINNVSDETLVTIRFRPELDNATIALGSNPLPVIEHNRVHIDASDVSSLTLDGERQAHLLRFAGEDFPDHPASIRLRGLKLINGYSDSPGGCLSLGIGGRASDADDRPEIEIIDSVFEQCKVESADFIQGGAISLSSFVRRVRITGSVFESNTAISVDSRADGGAIAAGRGQLRIDNSLFRNNQAITGGSRSAIGGAIAVFTSIFISSSEFIENTAAAGGAIFLSRVRGGGGLVENSLFSDNSAARGFDIYKRDGSMRAGFLHARNNMFVSLSGSGQASVYAQWSHVILNNNTYFLKSDTLTSPAGLQKAPNSSGEHASIRAANNVFVAPSYEICEIIPGEDWDDGLDVRTAEFNYATNESCDWLNADVHDSLNLTLARIRGFTRKGPVPESSDSVLISGGSPETPDGEIPACEPSDLRNAPRPGSGGDGEPRCDAGAFEWQHEPPLFQSCFEQGGCVR